MNSAFTIYQRDVLLTTSGSHRLTDKLIKPHVVGIVCECVCACVSVSIQVGWNNTKIVKQQKEYLWMIHGCCAPKLKKQSCCINIGVSKAHTSPQHLTQRETKGDHSRHH